jgi:hypothetical protein
MSPQWGSARPSSRVAPVVSWLRGGAHHSQPLPRSSQLQVPKAGHHCVAASRPSVLMELGGAKASSTLRASHVHQAEGPARQSWGLANASLLAAAEGPARKAGILRRSNLGAPSANVAQSLRPRLRHHLQSAAPLPGDNYASDKFALLSKLHEIFKYWISHANLYRLNTFAPEH